MTLLCKECKKSFKKTIDLFLGVHYKIILISLESIENVYSKFGYKYETDEKDFAMPDITGSWKSVYFY